MAVTLCPSDAEAAYQQLAGLLAPDAARPENRAGKPGRADAGRPRLDPHGRRGWQATERKGFDV